MPHNWCISSVIYTETDYRGEKNPGDYYWYNIIECDSEACQYFVYNINHSDDDYKLVGATTRHNKNEFKCSYNFPNNPFDMEEFIKENDIIRNLFFLNEKEVKELDYKFKNQPPYASEIQGEDAKCNVLIK